MKRLWLIIFAALVLMVTDHGQFWMDDFSEELFPDDQITVTVSSRISGLGIQVLDLESVTFPVSTVCPKSLVSCSAVVPAPVDVQAPPQPFLVTAVRIRPPPVLT